MRNIYHYCHCSVSTAESNDNLNEGCWKGFPPETNDSKIGLFRDLEWRTTHLGLKKQSDKSPQSDWKTLPDFWATCHSDIPWQLNEGMYEKMYGPLDGVRPKFWQSDRQALHGHNDFFGSTQAVQDPVKFFHRKDGTSSSSCQAKPLSCRLDFTTRNASDSVVDARRKIPRSLVRNTSPGTPGRHC